MTTTPTWREALEFAAETKSSDWPERCQKMVDMARKALMSDLKQKPIAWTLTETIEAKGSLYRAPLWFTDPQNTAWVPLYTIGAPPEAMDPDVRDAKHQLREVLGLPQTFDDWELHKLILLAVERIVALRNPQQAEAVPITSESGNQAAQGASAITSGSVPLLTDDEIDSLAETHLKVEIETHVGETEPVAWVEGDFDFARAIESLVRSKLGAGLGWIACEDQMPEPGTECLVRVKALSPTQNGPTHYTHIDTWDEQHEAPVSWSSATIPVGLGWDSFDFEDVTHWQPLPPPPGIVGKEGGK